MAESGQRVQVATAAATAAIDSSLAAKSSMGVRPDPPTTRPCGTSANGITGTAALGCAVLHGPDTVNSAAMTRALDDAGAALVVDGLGGLVAALDNLLGDRPCVAAMGEAGRCVAAEQGAVIDHVMAALEPWLGRI